MPTSLTMPFGFWFLPPYHATTRHAQCSFTPLLHHSIIILLSSSCFHAIMVIVKIRFHASVACRPCDDTSTHHATNADCAFITVLRSEASATTGRLRHAPWLYLIAPFLITSHMRGHATPPMLWAPPFTPITRVYRCPVIMSSWRRHARRDISHCQPPPPPLRATSRWAHATLMPFVYAKDYFDAPHHAIINTNLRKDPSAAFTARCRRLVWCPPRCACRRRKYATPSHAAPPPAATMIRVIIYATTTPIRLLRHMTCAITPRRFAADAPKHDAPFTIPTPTLRDDAALRKDCALPHQPNRATLASLSSAADILFYDTPRCVRFTMRRRATTHDMPARLRHAWVPPPRAINVTTMPIWCPTSPSTSRKRYGLLLYEHHDAMMTHMNAAMLMIFCHAAYAPACCRQSMPAPRQKRCYHAMIHTMIRHYTIIIFTIALIRRKHFRRHHWCHADYDDAHGMILFCWYDDDDAMICRQRRLIRRAAAAIRHYSASRWCAMSTTIRRLRTRDDAPLMILKIREWWCFICYSEMPIPYFSRTVAW